MSDITSGGFRTRRITNPLTPTYRVNGMDVADDPVKCRPRPPPKAKDGPFNPLTTADIEGATPGWRPLPQVNPPLEARRHFRNTNFMGDIPGAQADTVKHSICTERHVNPLNPVYASLDGEPLTNPQTPLYKEPACVEAEAQLDRSIAAEEFAAAAKAVAANAVISATDDGRASGKVISNQDDESQQQKKKQQQQHQQSWEAPIKQRPSSEPLRYARTGDGGGSADNSRGGGGEGIAGSGRGNRSASGVEFKYESSKPPLDMRLFSPAGDSGGVAAGDSSSIVNKERDERIRKLEDEMQLLRKEYREGYQRSGPAAPPGTGVTAPTGRHSHNNRTSSGGGGSGRKTARSWPGSGRQMSGGGSDGGGGSGAMVLRSRENNGSQLAERLVLRSASGMPRVSLTPSERRSAREYTEDVSSVRDLL